MKAKTLLTIGAAASIVSFVPVLPTGQILPEMPVTASVPEEASVVPPLEQTPHAAPRPAVAPNPRVASLLPVVDQPDILERHRNIADEVLRLLPANCRSRLENFYVRYNDPAQRGLGGKSTIIVTGNVPDNEFRGLLLHEALGHFWDLGCLNGNPASGASAFRDGKEVIYNDDLSVSFYAISWSKEKTQRPGSKKADFVSGYAATDAFEDLAESVAYYVLQTDAFQARAKTNTALAAKFAWLQKNVPFSLPLATSQLANTKTIPWDATRTAYMWNGMKVASK